MVKKHKRNDMLQKTTILFGYTLFVLLVLGTMFSTVVPFGVLAFQPHVRHINVLVTLLTLTISALLPLILAYIVGDKTTRTKNAKAHHLNGILLGFLAYWLSVFIGLVGSDVTVDIRQAVSEPLASVLICWPVVLTLLITIWVALNHTLRRTGTLLEYGPYQALLIVSAIVASAYALMPFYVFMPLLFIAISYVLLSTITSWRTRLTAAALAYTVGPVVTLSVFMLMTSFQFTPIHIPDFVTGMVSGVVGLVAWVAYLWRVRLS